MKKKTSNNPDQPIIDALEKLKEAAARVDDAEAEISKAEVAFPSTIFKDLPSDIVATRIANYEELVNVAAAAEAEKERKAAEKFAKTVQVPKSLASKCLVSSRVSDDEVAHAFIHEKADALLHGNYGNEFYLIVWRKQKNGEWKETFTVHKSIDKAFARLETIYRK